jgi:DNA adenine methylase
VRAASHELQTATIPKRPLLRYFGGKFQLRHWIVEHLPPHQFYAEPFAGAASVLMAKPIAEKGEIINDMNQEVTNLFRVMQGRESSQELIRKLKWTPYSQLELENAYKPIDDPVERARRIIVRSFMGITIAGTTAQKGSFRMGNVDLKREDREGKRTFRNCAADWRNWRECLETIRDRLSQVMIYERDALEFIDLMDSRECLLYLDPPYFHGKRSNTRYQVEFTDRNGVERHSEMVDRLLRCEAKVVLSGYACEPYARLEDAGWERVDKDYRANLSETRRTESLWISPSAQRSSSTIEAPKSLFD